MKPILTFVSLIFSLVTSFAQQNTVVGDWGGTLSGTKLRLVFHIAEKDGLLSTTLDSPDQGAFGLVCDKTEFSENRLVIGFSAAGASFEGILGEDQVIKGKWNQRGASIDLELKRKDGTDKPEIKPQTPRPPFPYHSEDITFDNADKSIHYGATLTYPNGDGPFPAAILITGSGKQDRDETLGLHKPFAVIADYLTKQGFAVLRVDDRAMGTTTGDYNASTSADFANDVEAEWAYLKTRKEIKHSKIGLIGHSEGGLIGPMVAARNPGIAFVVLLAGPGVPIRQLMSEQSEAILRSAGVSDEAVKSYMILYNKLIISIPEASSAEVSRAKAQEVFRQWQTTTTPEIVKASTGITDSISAARFVHRFADQCFTPWFRYFLRYNPQPALGKVNCPVLALNGEKDIQVLPKSNLAGIQASVKKNKLNKIEMLPGLNHLFQTCKTCSINEYLTLDETFSPSALEVIGGWLKIVVK